MNFYFGDDLSGGQLVFKQSNWNDYGYRTLFDCTLVKNNESISMGTVSFASIREAEAEYKKTQDTSSNYKWVSYDVSDFLENSYSDQLSENIVSLGSTEYYQSLYEKLDSKTVKKILKNLNDIAFNTDLYKKNININVIQVSFLREIKAYTLENQLSRIAKNGKEKINYTFTLKYQFPYGIKCLEFEVDPDSILPSNVFALIGSNGTGKTTIIHDLVKAYREENRIRTSLCKDSKVMVEFSDEDQNIPLESILFISFSSFDLINSSSFGNDKRV